MLDSGLDDSFERLNDACDTEDTSPIEQIYSKSAELDSADFEYEELSEADLQYLDDNTIDEYFLPRVLDENGDKISLDESRHDSPFLSQYEPENEGDIVFEPDAFSETRLVKGLDLYQLSSPDGTKSCFFTDQATVDKCTDSKTGEVDIYSLKQMLQITDTNGLKTVLTKYTVNNDGIRAAVGMVRENTEFGSGGGTQYFIPHANEMKENGLLS